MQKMSKEEFLEIISSQEHSGLTIKIIVPTKPILNRVFTIGKGSLGYQDPIEVVASSPLEMLLLR